MRSGLLLQLLYCTCHVQLGCLLHIRMVRVRSMLETLQFALYAFHFTANLLHFLHLFSPLRLCGCCSDFVRLYLLQQNLHLFAQLLLCGLHFQLHIRLVRVRSMLETLQFDLHSFHVLLHVLHLLGQDFHVLLKLHLHSELCIALFKFACRANVCRANVQRLQYCAQLLILLYHCFPHLLHRVPHLLMQFLPVEHRAAALLNYCFPYLLRLFSQLLLCTGEQELHFFSRLQLCCHYFVLLLSVLHFPRFVLTKSPCCCLKELR
jgi:hypothetical protein